MTTPLNIYQAINKIMGDVGAIGKDRKNQQQGYQFRGVDDVYESLQLLLAKYGICTVPTVLEDKTEERLTKNGNTLIYRVLRIRYTFYAMDGSSVEATVIGEGMDSGDKAANKAMSVAHKYALLQVFCIPTSEPKDPENESHELQAKNDRPKQSAPREQPVGGGGFHQRPTALLSAAQVGRLYAIAKAKGWSQEQVKDFILNEFNKKSMNDVTRAEADQLEKAMNSAQPRSQPMPSANELPPLDDIPF